MSYSITDRLADPALPSDITLRAPIYRRRGVIASTVTTLLAVSSARRQLRAITRGYRKRPVGDLPDYLRQDLGLPPLPPRLPTWWELQRW